MIITRQLKSIAFWITMVIALCLFWMFDDEDDVNEHW